MVTFDTSDISKFFCQVAKMSIFSLLWFCGRIKRWIEEEQDNENKVANLQYVVLDLSSE